VQLKDGVGVGAALAARAAAALHAFRVWMAAGSWRSGKGSRRRLVKPARGCSPLDRAAGATPGCRRSPACRGAPAAAGHTHPPDVGANHRHVRVRARVAARGLLARVGVRALQPVVCVLRKRRGAGGQGGGCSTGAARTGRRPPCASPGNLSPARRADRAGRRLARRSRRSRGCLPFSEQHAAVRAARPLQAANAVGHPAGWPGEPAAGRPPVAFTKANPGLQRPAGTRRGPRRADLGQVWRAGGARFSPPWGTCRPSGACRAGDSGGAGA
jgi:hypothetical protein